MKNSNCKRKFTEKDLAYLEDMFSWNMQALKLVNHFMNETENEEVSEILEEVFDIHYENLNKCVGILEGKHQEEYEDECECRDCDCEYEEEYEDEDEEEDDE